MLPEYDTTVRAVGQGVLEDMLGCVCGGGGVLS